MVSAGEAKLVDGTWVVKAEPHIMMRLKRVFGRAAKGKTAAIKLRDTPEICRDLEWFSERFPLTFTPADHLTSRAKLHKDTAQAVEALLAGTVSTRAFQLAIPAREYQQVAAEVLLRRRSLLLADELGVGKTASAICAISQPEMRPALVVTLTSLPEQWRREINRFAPGMRVHILKGAKPYDLTKVKTQRGQRELFEDFPDVIISNYHKLAEWADALAGKVRSVTFDEAQELRNGGEGPNVSDKYAAAKDIAAAAMYRMALTGTPIYNYGIEWWSILSVIAPDELGDKSEFVIEWCTGGNDERRATINDPKAFGTYLRESGLMLRRTRSDVGRELPEATQILHHVDADLAELGKVESSAAQLARLILRAGTGGFDKMRASEELNHKLRQATGIAKAPFVAAFVRMLVESGEKVVLFGWHHAVYEIWRESLVDLGVVFFTGQESPTKKQAALKEFTEGPAKIFVMSLRAGAGLDGLQKVCRTAVFGELDWSPGAMEQCAGRILRDMQPDPVMIYTLLADVGSDPIIADVLGLKRGQMERVRDPDAKLVQKLEVDPHHVQRLAEAYLEQIGEKKRGAA